MAMNRCVVRRASSLIAWATRSAALNLVSSPAPGSPSALGLFASRFLRFSTSSADGSYHNIGDEVEKEIANYSDVAFDVPSGFPFKVDAPLGSKAVFLERRFHKEKIAVEAPSDMENTVNGDGPCLPITVYVEKGKLEVLSYMTARPDQLQIHKVIVRNYNTDSQYYTKYLKSKGITSKTVGFICDRLYRQNND